jgi:hypothetical protein
MAALVKALPSKGVWRAVLGGTEIAGCIVKIGCLNGWLSWD